MVNEFRDVKASFIAGDLIHDGYLGEDYQYFGLAYWQDGSLHYLISEDQTKAFDTVEQKLYQGIITTPVLELFGHFQITDTPKETIRQEFKEKLKENLVQEYSFEYFCVLQGFADLSNDNTAYSLLAQYRRSVSQATTEQQQAFNGLVITARTAKILTPGSSVDLMNKNGNPAFPCDDTNSSNTMSGFAYQENNIWLFYSNGNHAQTIKKKMQLTDRKILTTPILKYSHAVNNPGGQVHIMRTELLSVMQKTFDENYLSVLQELQAQATPVDRTAFRKSIDSVKGKLSPQALTSIKGYGFLWHVQEA
jgi:hypothetical protein